VAPNTSAVDWWVPKNRHGSRKLSQNQRRRVLGRIGHTANPLLGNVQLFFTILHNISSHSDTKAEGIFRHIRWMAQIKLSMHRKMFLATLGDFFRPHQNFPVAFRPPMPVFVRPHQNFPVVFHFLMTDFCTLYSAHVPALTLHTVECTCVRGSPGLDELP